MSIALNLIAVALGYKMLTDALKEKAAVRLLGLVLGALVLVVAVASSACSLMKCMSMNGCSLMGKSMCPMMGDKTGAKPVTPA